MRGVVRWQKRHQFLLLGNPDVEGQRRVCPQWPPRESNLEQEKKSSMKAPIDRKKPIKQTLAELEIRKIRK